MVNKKVRIKTPVVLIATVVLLTIILSLTMVDIFTSAARALVQSTTNSQSITQNTVCSGDTCTTTSCTNGVCRTTTTTSSGSSNNFALSICDLFGCTSTTSP